MSFSRRGKLPGSEADHSHHLPLALKIQGALPPFPIRVHIHGVLLNRAEWQIQFIPLCLCVFLLTVLIWPYLTLFTNSFVSFSIFVHLLSSPLLFATHYLPFLFLIAIFDVLSVVSLNIGKWINNVQFCNKYRPAIYDNEQLKVQKKLKFIILKYKIKCTMLRSTKKREK